MKLKKRLKSYGAKLLEIKISDVEKFMLENNAFYDFMNPDLMTTWIKKYIYTRIEGKLKFMKIVSNVEGIITIRYTSEKLPPLKTLKRPVSR